MGSSQLLDVSQKENGLIGCLLCLTIVSRDDHVLNFSATMVLIIVAGFRSLGRFEESSRAQPAQIGRCNVDPRV